MRPLFDWSRRKMRSKAATSGYHFSIETGPLSVCIWVMEGRGTIG